MKEHSQPIKVLIGLDCSLGGLLFQGIKARETISAYCWRKGYIKRIALIDMWFGANHCKESYESEMNAERVK